jgi:hypothetical protein
MVTFEHNLKGINLSEHWFVRLIGTGKYMHSLNKDCNKGSLWVFAFKPYLNGATLFHASELQKTRFLLATGEVELIRASEVVPRSEPINAERLAAIAYSAAMKYMASEAYNLITYPFRRMKKKWSKPTVKQISIESLENQISVLQHRIKVLSDNYLNDPDGNASRLDEMVVLSKELAGLQSKYAKLLKQKKHELTTH